MGSKTVMYSLESDSSLEEVKNALKRSLIFLGGSMMDMGEGIQITQGVNEVKYAAGASLKAIITIQNPQPGKFNFFANITWSPNGVFWICLVVGFFVFGVLWIVPFFYLFIDPTPAYQQAFYRIPTFLKSG